jgi:ArsR family transcriptional regulator
VDETPQYSATGIERVWTSANAARSPPRLSRKQARVCSQTVDELPLAQSTVSEHLRILKEAGLVRSAGDRARIGYCIDFNGLRRLNALTAII